MKADRLFAFSSQLLSDSSYDLQAVAGRTCDHQQLGLNNWSQQPQLFMIPDLWGVQRDPHPVAQQKQDPN